jgi:tRNA dimethylallyltransferase
LQTGKEPALPFELRALRADPADREALNRRIAERFDAMLAAGLVDEVRACASAID